LTYIGILLSFSLALTACAGAAGPVVSSGDRYTATNDEIEDYRLGVGDKVRLTVFNEETLSGEFAVSANGTLSLPLIGDVTATGKGVEDITKLVEARLADGYVRDPKVNIEITTYRPFFILGEVRQPGQYPYAAGMTVTNAIALAQGYTPRAVQGSVFIRSAGGATEKGYRLTPDLRVRPGDTIRINERYF
jgi:polysaccharide export outer membrane protein